jgi:hypothetical protein
MQDADAGARRGAKGDDDPTGAGARADVVPAGLGLARRLPLLVAPRCRWSEGLSPSRASRCSHCCSAPATARHTVPPLGNGVPGVFAVPSAQRWRCTVGQATRRWRCPGATRARCSTRSWGLAWWRARNTWPRLWCGVRGLCGHCVVALRRQCGSHVWTYVIHLVSIRT